MLHLACGIARADVEEVLATQAERLQLEKHLGDFMFKSTERLKGPGTEPNSTFAIRELAYDDVPDALDEYLQMGATTSRRALAAFSKAIMELYGDEFLRKPTYTNIKKFYAFHEQKHGFLG
ncbi:hypothetical protein Tco_0353433 [Tanacetum coccineum]